VSSHQIRCPSRKVRDQQFKCCALIISALLAGDFLYLLEREQAIKTQINSEEVRASSAVHQSFEHTAQQFVALFPYRFDSVVRQSNSTNWRQVSRFYSLSDEDIIKSVEGKSTLIRGCHCDTKTRFIVLRIPAGSNYHNMQAVLELRQKLSTIAIKPKHYQEENEDWHLYIFFSHWVDSTKAANDMRSWLKKHGVIAAQGSLEIYPEQPCLPIPLQKTFTWLNESCQSLVRRDELSLAEALALFLNDINQDAVEPESFFASMSTAEDRAPEEIECSEVSRQIGQVDVQPIEPVQTPQKTKENKARPRPVKTTSLHLAEKEKVIQLALPMADLGLAAGGLKPPVVELRESRAPP
jgi:hypothetical protein